MAEMWLGPALFVVVSMFLWRYASAVFIPELLARRVFAYIPGLAGLETVVLVNMALMYFAPYMVFALYWRRLKIYLKHPFIGALALWAGNVFILFPAMGRGILGYRLPQGWFAVCLPLLVSHWVFARGLQFQLRKR